MADPRHSIERLKADVESVSRDDLSSGTAAEIRRLELERRAAVATGHFLIENARTNALMAYDRRLVARVRHQLDYGRDYSAKGVSL